MLIVDQVGGGSLGTNILEILPKLESRSKVMKRDNHNSQLEAYMQPGITATHARKLLQ